MTLPNQIGLEGDVTPPQFMADVELEPDTRDYNTTELLDWPWLRIERHFGFHYDEPEIAIELRLPWSIDFGVPGGRRMPRSCVLVFGRVHTRLVSHAWHVRGALDYWTNPDWL